MKGWRVAGGGGGSGAVHGGGAAAASSGQRQGATAALGREPPLDHSALGSSQRRLASRELVAGFNMRAQGLASLCVLQPAVNTGIGVIDEQLHLRAAGECCKMGASTAALPLFLRHIAHTTPLSSLPLDPPLRQS